MLLPFNSVLMSLVLVASTSTVVDAVAVRLGRRTGKATLNFSTKINSQGAVNIAEAERARVAALLQSGHVSGIGVTNDRFYCVAQVGVGTPPTNYTLLVDTGSANTFVGADKAYVKTSSSVDTGYYVSVPFNSGVWYGTEWNDTVTLSLSLVVKQQSIGVASETDGFPSGIDGVLGVGPVNLTRDTVQGMNTVPTVLDNLYAQGTIQEEVLGVYFVPYAESQGHDGQLTFGGYDESVVTTSVAYVPLTKSYPASLSWGIEQSIRYGNETILSSTAGIVDTSTSLTLIATDAFEKYQNLTGGVKDNSTGLLTITTSQYDKLQPLYFDVGGTLLELTPNAQIWPRVINTAIGGSAGKIYLVVADIGYTSGSGLDFINGYTFLERFYSVYDTTNQRVGFASTEYTSSEGN